MENNEGELLRRYIRTADKTQEEFAEFLSMTRQNLGYHMRKEKLDKDFKELLLSKGVDLFSKKKVDIVEEGTPIYELSATATQTEYSGQLPACGTALLRH
jgi:hypothetical protein